MENSFKVGDRVRCIKDVEIHPSGGSLERSVMCVVRI